MSTQVARKYVPKSISPSLEQAARKWWQENRKSVLLEAADRPFPITEVVVRAFVAGAEVRLSRAEALSDEAYKQTLADWDAEKLALELEEGEKA